jgi:hypothetical protein
MAVAVGLVVPRQRRPLAEVAQGWLVLAEMLLVQLEELLVQMVERVAVLVLALWRRPILAEVEVLVLLWLVVVASMAVLPSVVLQAAGQEAEKLLLLHILEAVGVDKTELLS